MSPFLVNKLIISTIGEVADIKKLRSGDLLIETNSKKQATTLSKLSTLGTWPVSVSLHKTLNVSRGVISEQTLVQHSDNELQEEFKSQGVCAARRILIRRNGQLIPTKHVVLTFEESFARASPRRETQTFLSFQFRIAQNTISGIIPAVCMAIFQVLENEFIKVPDRPEKWREVANDFLGMCGIFPCAWDGKHISIIPPPKSGSAYYNYKQFFSIVLMALVDANLNFFYVDTGTNGRVSDGGV
ncbi:unnamed protein product [Larinioides sclopetarius]|uniref:DDE Tnp4 domain-containing protein n=1 Tax=Larinioides sclopetarius TaxID=280406 RepID=A0AAV2BJK4_9ARAC